MFTTVFPDFRQLQDDLLTAEMTLPNDQHDYGIGWHNETNGGILLYGYLRKLKVIFFQFSPQFLYNTIVFSC